MQITDLEPIIVGAGKGALGPGDRTWLFVEVHTDEGLPGADEASQSRLDRGVATGIGEMKPYYVGGDPVGVPGATSSSPAPR